MYGEGAGADGGTARIEISVLAGQDTVGSAIAGMGNDGSAQTALMNVKVEVLRRKRPPQMNVHELLGVEPVCGSAGYRQRVRVARHAFLAKIFSPEDAEAQIVLRTATESCSLPGDRRGSEREGSRSRVRSLRRWSRHKRNRHEGQDAYYRNQYAERVQRGTGNDS